MSHAPAGFLPHASGLLVPEAQARRRVVVSYDDWKKLDRGLEALNQCGLRFQFRCEHGCKAVEKIRTLDGGTNLRCDCTDRLFTRAF